MLTQIFSQILFLHPSLPKVTSLLLPIPESWGGGVPWYKVLCFLAFLKVSLRYSFSGLLCQLPLVSFPTDKILSLFSLLLLKVYALKNLFTVILLGLEGGAETEIDSKASIFNQKFFYMHLHSLLLK